MWLFSKTLQRCSDHLSCFVPKRFLAWIHGKNVLPDLGCFFGRRFVFFFGIDDDPGLCCAEKRVAATPPPWIDLWPPALGGGVQALIKVSTPRTLFNVSSGHLAQFYSVNFSQSRISVKKCVFRERSIKVCVSCSRWCPGTFAPSAAHQTVSLKRGWVPLKGAVSA